MHTSKKALIVAALFTLPVLAAPQMTLVLGNMSPHKQDQAKLILKNHVANVESPRKVQHSLDERVNIGGEWRCADENLISIY